MSKNIWATLVKDLVTQIFQKMPNTLVTLMAMAIFSSVLPPRKSYERKMKFLSDFFISLSAFLFICSKDFFLHVPVGHIP